MEQARHPGVSQPAGPEMSLDPYTEKDAPLVLAPALALAILAAVGVNVANVLEVPGMNLRDGFHGAGFLMEFLYAVQPPVWLGMALVGGLYFLYGAVAGCVLGLLLRVLWNHA